MELDVGKSIPCGYQLISKLSMTGWYLSTWRARDPQGLEVVVKIHCTVVSDDYPSVIDLRDKISPLCPRLDRLVAARATPGLAPWLSYTYDPDGGFVFLVRRYYATRLDERFPPLGGKEGGTPNRDLLSAFRHLAEGLDAVCRSEGECPALAVHGDNLFMDGSQGVIADYGCSELEKAVEDGYSGPRPVDGRVLKRLGEHLFLGRPTGDAGEKAQWALAAAYFRVRTGRSVFGDAAGGATSNIAESEACRQVVEYVTTKRLDLGLLPHAGERAALARALAVDPCERFRSCVQFVQRLVP